MKVERRETFDDKTIFLITIDGHELITSMPSVFEKETLRLYEKTKTVADGLMYLSEVAQRIEDHKLAQRIGKE
jgi:hypothetical protein